MHSLFYAISEYRDKIEDELLARIEKYNSSCEDDPSALRGLTVLDNVHLEITSLECKVWELSKEADKEAISCKKRITESS